MTTRPGGGLKALTAAVSAANGPVLLKLSCVSKKNTTNPLAVLRSPRASHPCRGRLASSFRMYGRLPEGSGGIAST